MDNETTIVEGSQPSVSEDVKASEQNTPLDTAANADVEQKQEAPAKTFTQEELDAALQKRLAKEERKWTRKMESALAERQSTTPKEEPRRESFRDDEAFLNAHIEHMAEQKAIAKLAEREQAQKEQAEAEEREKRAEAFESRAESVRKNNADYDDVISDARLHRADTVSNAMVDFIADSDVGADVLYYLGKNIKESQRIAELSPTRAVKELARIEAELVSKPQRQTSAPPPISPITANNGSAHKSPSDSDDTETWMRKERERMRKR
jgi:hypothetical protein